MARRPAAPGVDRRQQILEAALDVFAEEGFEGATTKEIAARADVTQGLIYFYFPSKEELFLAAYEHQAKLAFAHLHFPTAEECGESPEIALRRAVSQFVETLDAPRSVCLMRIMMRVAAHGRDHGHIGAPSDERRQHIRDQAQIISTNLRQYLDTQIACGTIRPVDTALAAQLFIHSMMLTVMRRASGDESLAHLTRQQLVDNLVGIFLRGLLAHADAGVLDRAPATL